MRPGITYRAARRNVWRGTPIAIAWAQFLVPQRAGNAFVMPQAQYRPRMTLRDGRPVNFARA